MEDITADLELVIELGKALIAVAELAEHLDAAAEG